MSAIIQEKANELFLNSEILAPMVRASTTPLRLLALSYGADLVYTEEIIDRSITSTDRIVNEKLGTIDYVKKLSTFSKKAQKKMLASKQLDDDSLLPIVLRIDPAKEKAKLIFQMGTGESHLALSAATMVANDVSGIDINMGCPKKFSVSGGMGSALLSDVQRATDIVKTLRNNLNIPISCKIRLLDNEKETIDFVQALINAGANAVAIHGRQVGDESTKPAKLDTLVNTVQLIKSTGAMEHIPIILNGDLYTRNDIINLKRKSGADGVMLARPALYNTSIFRKPFSITSNQEIIGNNNNDININHDSNEEEEEETRYGYDSLLLESKPTVIQNYLRLAKQYKTHYKNTKYVICEMMNNRRTPSVLSPYMPHIYPGKQNINMVCNCKSIDELCKVWDVKLSMLANASSSTNNNNTNNTTEKASSSLSLPLDHKEKVENGIVNTAIHRYDDRYFLDPEALRKEQEVRQNNNITISNDDGHDAKESKEDKNKCDQKHKSEIHGENDDSDVKRPRLR